MIEFKYHSRCTLRRNIWAGTEDGRPCVWRYESAAFVEPSLHTGVLFHSSAW